MKSMCKLISRFDSDPGVIITECHKFIQPVMRALLPGKFHRLCVKHMTKLFVSGAFLKGGCILSIFTISKLFFLLAKI